MSNKTCSMTSGFTKLLTDLCLDVQKESVFATYIEVEIFSNHR